jgi:hypothetical protein
VSDCVRLPRYSCLDLQIQLFESVDTAVWICRYSCLDLEIQLFGSADTAVWIYRYSCLDLQIQLFGSTDTAVWIKFRPVSAQLFHAGGRTDIENQIVAFCNFANAHDEV